MMELSNSALRAELGTCLEALQTSLARFATHVQLRAHAVWLWQAPAPGAQAFDPPAPEPPREQVVETLARAITRIKYEDGQDPHESYIAPGVIAVSEEGIELADEVNQHKRTLARVLRDMRDRREIDLDPHTGARVTRPLPEVALEAFYFRRLHYFQATRELAILRQHRNDPRPPDYIGFMWATVRDIRRTSREELLESLRETRLRETPPPHIERDIEALEDLPAGEPLAKVRGPQIIPRVNLSWPGPAGKPPTRTSRVAVLPLVMLGRALPSRLRKLPSAPAPSSYRLDRTDKELEPVPYLATLPIYRYLPQFRDGKRRAP